MGKIIIKFLGDAKIGIFRKSQNTVDFYPRSGIAVLIDRKVLSYLENGKVYSITNPKFRILEKCVILEGEFNIVSDSDCKKESYYVESIYITHPIRVVKIQYTIQLTSSLEINSMGMVENQINAGVVVIKEEDGIEESPLPSEYQWMLDKISAGKKIFSSGGIYLSQDDNLEIVDARIVKSRFMRMAEYSIKTSLPVYEVSYVEYKEEWGGQKLFHLKVIHFAWGKDAIFYPEDGVVKVTNCFQEDDRPEISLSILTDESRAIDDGEFPSGFAKAMMRMYPRSSRSSSSYSSSDSKPKLSVGYINRSGNVVVVEFWGRKYALAYNKVQERVYWDHLVTDDLEEVSKMIREREERIKTETFELEREKAIFCITGQRSSGMDYYPYKDYSDELICRDGFGTENIPMCFPNKWEEKTNLFKQLEELRVHKVEVLKNASSLEDLEKTKKEFLEKKNKIGEIYSQGKDMISQFSNFFSEILSNTMVSFVSEQVSELYKEIQLLEDIACDGDLEKLEQKIEELKHKVERLPNLSISQKGIVEENEFEARKNLLQEAGNLGVPVYLLDIFGGNIQRAIQFMSNVVKIETWRLDANEFSCGRSRARSTCEDAWSAMGETTDFFCGADPNDVKYYVNEHHFGEDAVPVAHKEKKGSYNNNLSNSNDAMEEALRRAGLIP